MQSTTIPVDLAHLSRQTGGNDALGREVLEMFVATLPADLAELRSASSAERRALAHRLVGSARAIGAGAMAAAASAVEAGGDGLDALEAAATEAQRFIEAYLSA
jgi:HPt (histidine-containing phosphotransfer) domain-containing protein